LAKLINYKSLQDILSFFLKLTPGYVEVVEWLSAYHGAAVAFVLFASFGFLEVHHVGHSVGYLVNWCLRGVRLLGVAGAACSSFVLGFVF
jgi:hypothetical protein